MNAFFDAIELWSHQGMTATEYTAAAFYVLTGLFLLLTYLTVRQDWAEICAWVSLGCVAVAIHFMVVSWREIAVPGLGLMPVASSVRSDDVGSRFKDCPDCPEMVVIPSGYFVMGADDATAEPAEGPLRRMMIQRRFAISRETISPTDVAKWAKATAGAGGVCADAGAACSSWLDAQAYSQWLANRTGKAFRLPSAAEWEYVARAGAPAPTIQAAAPLLKASFTSPVGKPATNGFGVAGLGAGTAEFVADCWSSNLSALPSDGRSLQASSGADCRQRVVKIGLPGTPVRYSGRLPVEAAAAQMNVGFRVVRELPAKAK